IASDMELLAGLYPMSVNVRGPVPLMAIGLVDVKVIGALLGPVAEISPPNSVNVKLRSVKPVAPEHSGVPPFKTRFPPALDELPIPLLSPPFASPVVCNVMPDSICVGPSYVLEPLSDTLPNVFESGTES